MFRLLDINLHSKQRIKKTLMTEFEKMRNSELYDFSDAETMESIKHANRLCRRLQTMTSLDADYREVIEELIPGIPASTTVNPPFHCDHGNGIKLGENVFINYNCTMLDYLQRRKTVETGYPITIGEDCWLGAGVIVCPGVTIGDRSIIGAGSVVVKDIPEDSVAVGNPARVIKKLK